MYYLIISEIGSYSDYSKNNLYICKKEEQAQDITNKLNACVAKIADFEKTAIEAITQKYWTREDFGNPEMVKLMEDARKAFYLENFSEEENKLCVQFELTNRAVYDIPVFSVETIQDFNLVNFV